MCIARSSMIESATFSLIKTDNSGTTPTNVNLTTVKASSENCDGSTKKNQLENPKLSKTEFCMPLNQEALDKIELKLSAILNNPPENVSDPIKRLCSLVDSSHPRNLSLHVPLKRLCDVLEDVYNVANMCVVENNIYKGFVFYLRFLGVAVEELGKHVDYENLSEELRIKFCKQTVTAINTAEQLKKKIMKTFNKEATEYQTACKVRQGLYSKLTLKSQQLPTCPVIRGNLGSYTPCGCKMSHTLLFQRIILPDNLPEHFLLLSAKSINGTAFGHLYGKLIRNNLIVSHLIIYDDEKRGVQDIKKFISLNSADDNEPASLILIGGISHSLEDTLMQKFILSSMLSEIVCVFVPKDDKRCCVVHLSNLLSRRNNGTAFLTNLLLKDSPLVSQLVKEYGKQIDEAPTTSFTSKDESNLKSPPIVHHSLMCNHVHVTPMLSLVHMSLAQMIAEAKVENAETLSENQPNSDKTEVKILNRMEFVPQKLLCIQSDNTDEPPLKQFKSESGNRELLPCKSAPTNKLR